MAVKYPATISIADLVKQIKRVSSHFVNETLQPDTHGFKGQGFYGAFTVSRDDVSQIIAYVKRQKEHHAVGELVLEWEEEFEVVKDNSEAPST